MHAPQALSKPIFVAKKASFAYNTHGRSSIAHTPFYQVIIIDCSRLRKKKKFMKCAHAYHKRTHAKKTHIGFLF